MANSRQLSLELELNFLNMLHTKLNLNEKPLSESDIALIQPLIDVLPDLKKPDLLFLLNPLNQAYQQLHSESPLISNDIGPFNQIIVATLQRLRLNSHRKKNTHFIQARITEAKADINTEMTLLPFIEELQSYIRFKCPRNTGKRLALIGSHLISDLAEEDITDTENQTYKIAGLFSSALYYLIRNEFKYLQTPEKQKDLFSFWVNVLQKSDEIGDTHSITAILSALKEYETSIEASQVILQLPDNLKKAYHFISKKYDLAENSVTDSYREYQSAIAPHLGHIKQLILHQQEKIQPDQVRENALEKIKLNIHTAKGRAEAYMIEKKLFSSPRRARIQQLKLDLKEVKKYPEASSSEPPLTPHSLEATSSNYRLFSDTASDFKRSKSTHGTPTTSPRPNKR